MTHRPFDNTIDTEYLATTENQKCILHKLKLVVAENSFGLLVGDSGTGKSTLLRKFQSLLDPNEYLILYVSMSNATPKWLYTIPLQKLGIKPHCYVNTARDQFHKEIQTQRQSYGKKVVMIIDEAHLLTQSYRKYDLLEEIRFLLNGKTYDSGSPLSLILAGQTEILETLRNERCKAIMQRIQYFAETALLSRDEINQYVAAHIKWSGATDLLFSSEAMDKIAELSNGSLRLINKLCSHSLNYASLELKPMVDLEIVERVAKHEIIDLIIKHTR